MIGAYPQDADDVARLATMGVTRVLNLVEDREYRRGARTALEAALAGAGIAEQRLELVDFGGLAAEQIEQAVTAVLAWLRDGEGVYLHCRAGRQRSAAVAAGVVALREDVDLDTALERVGTRRPSADPLPHQREDLAAWWAGR